MISQSQLFNKLQLALKANAYDEIKRNLKQVKKVESDQFLLFLIYKCLPLSDSEIQKQTFKILEDHIDRIEEPLKAVLNHPNYAAHDKAFLLLGNGGKLTSDELKEVLAKPENDDIKISAIDLLIKEDDKAAFEFLIGLMVNPSWALRRHLTKTLLAQGDKLVPAIKKVFSGGDLHQKYWALKLLIDLSGPKAFKQIRKLLLSNDKTVQLYAIAALEYLPGEKALGMLFAAMLENSPLMRYQASYVLAKKGEETIKEAISLMKKKGPELKDELIVIIGRILGAKCRTFFKSMLKSKNPDERYYALMALGQNPDIEGVRILVEALTDPVWVIRHMSSNLLAHLVPQAREELIKALNSANFDKVYWACKTLGEGKDPLAARSLMNLVDHHPDPNVRVSAVNALCLLDLEFVADMLILNFEDDALSVRNSILTGLGEMSREKVIKILLIQLFSGNKKLSFWCEKTLKYMKFKSLQSVLELLVTLDEIQTEKFISYIHQLKPENIIHILNKEKVTLETFDPDNVSDKEFQIVPLSDYRNLDDLLVQLREMKGSDLHLNVGLPPMFRVHGELMRTSLPPLDEEKSSRLINTILNEEQKRNFDEKWEIDFSHEVKHIGRFRANIFKQRQGLSGVFRLIPTKIPSFEEMGLPRMVFEDICDNRQGLVLVTGPTGSGKSTTMAGMVDAINKKRYEHILTIEDPIEFVHQHKRCSINQRELGTHTHSFAHALKSALREDPDVILVGEMRDPETIKLALTAAETGHLVFSTLHTISAGESINRIIGAFPAEFQEQIRLELSGVLRAIVSQKLIPRADKKGRILAYELLICNLAIKNLIKEAKTEQIPSIMQTAQKEQMQTMDQALARLVALEQAHLDAVRPHVTDKKSFEQLLTSEKDRGLENVSKNKKSFEF